MKVLACLVALTLGFPADFTVKKLSNSKPDFYNCSIEYLEFHTKHPMATAINPVLQSLALNRQSEWLSNAKEMRKEAGKPISPWEIEIGMEVNWNTSKLVTVIVSNYNYSGGAHPNHGIEVLNFGLVNGKARKLKLEDFFSPGFNPDKHVSKLVIAKLRKTEGADWVQNGDLQRLDAKMLSRFTPSATGLTWHFNPYDVGPYAAGDFEVKLSLKELGPKFNRAMLQTR